jgi:putative membrane protein insertion efficiency factor
MISFIKIYQKIISPLLQGRCKYYPTCSFYMVNAIKKYGYIKGINKGVFRIVRCNPFSKGGIDEA